MRGGPSSPPGPRVSLNRRFTDQWRPHQSLGQTPVSVWWMAWHPAATLSSLPPNGRERENMKKLTRAGKRKKINRKIRPRRNDREWEGETLTLRLQAKLDYEVWVSVSSSACQNPVTRPGLAEQEVESNSGGETWKSLHGNEQSEIWAKSIRFLSQVDVEYLFG